MGKLAILFFIYLLHGHFLPRAEAAESAAVGAKRKQAESDLLENTLKVAEDFSDIRQLFKFWTLAKQLYPKPPDLPVEVKLSGMTSESRAKMKILAQVPDEIALHKVWFDARGSLLRHPHLTNPALDTVESFFDAFKRLEHLFKKAWPADGKPRLLPIPQPSSKAVIADTVAFVNFWNNSFNLLNEKPSMELAYPGEVMPIDTASKLMQLKELDNMWESKSTPIKTPRQNDCNMNNLKTLMAAEDVFEIERRWRVAVSLFKDGPPYVADLVAIAGPHVTGLECVEDLVGLQNFWHGAMYIKLFNKNRGKSVGTFRDFLEIYTILMRIAKDWLTSVRKIAVGTMVNTTGEIDQAFNQVASISSVLTDPAILNSPEAKMLIPYLKVEQPLEEPDPTADMSHYFHQLGDLKVLYDSWKRLDAEPELTPEALAVSPDPFFKITGEKNSGLDNVIITDRTYEVVGSADTDGNLGPGGGILVGTGKDKHLIDPSTGEELDTEGHSHGRNPNAGTGLGSGKKSIDASTDGSSSLFGGGSDDSSDSGTGSGTSSGSAGSNSDGDGASNTPSGRGSGDGKSGFGSTGGGSGSGANSAGGPVSGGGSGKKSKTPVAPVPGSNISGSSSMQAGSATSSGKLSGGAIAGIVIGSIILLLLLLATAYFCFTAFARGNKERAREASAASSVSASSS